MSLRWRLALAMGSLLLAMVTLVSVSAYLTTDRRLHDEVDTSLDERADALRLVLNRAVDRPRRPGGDTTVVLPSNTYLAQLLGPDGQVLATAGDVVFPIDERERTIAVSGGRPYRRTVDVDGAPYRVETVALRFGGAVQVGRELQPTRDTLSSLARRYTVTSALVALLGAILGWLLASWLTRPVTRLTAAAEHVARTGDLDADVDASRRDETGRLASAFSSMLAALRDSRERQRRLVQDASHELRTPITSIRTNIDVLRRHPDLDVAERAAVLADVNSELTQVTAMVDELVLMASGEAEPAEVSADVALHEVVEAAAERARRRTGRRITVDAEPTVLHGSVKALDRAVSNLLDNAAKFSPDGTPIELTLAAGRVMVRDHGPGIASEDLPNVFERFYRATTARTQPGSGLGLAIVEQVARAHGGAPFAQNHPDGGAVVGFTVPVASRSAGWAPPVAP